MPYVGLAGPATQLNRVNRIVSSMTSPPGGDGSFPSGFKAELLPDNEDPAAIDVGLLKGASGPTRSLRFLATVSAYVEQAVSGGYLALMLQSGAINGALTNITTTVLLEAVRAAGFPFVQISVLEMTLSEDNAPPSQPPAAPSPAPLAPSPIGEVDSGALMMYVILIGSASLVFFALCMLGYDSRARRWVYRCLGLQVSKEERERRRAERARLKHLVRTVNAGGGGAQPDSVDLCRSSGVAKLSFAHTEFIGSRFSRQLEAAGRFNSAVSSGHEPSSPARTSRSGRSATSHAITDTITSLDGQTCAQHSVRSGQVRRTECVSPFVRIPGLAVCASPEGRAAVGSKAEDASKDAARRYGKRRRPEAQAAAEARLDSWFGRTFLRKLEGSYRVAREPRREGAALSASSSAPSSVNGMAPSAGSPQLLPTPIAPTPLALSDVHDPALLALASSSAAVREAAVLTPVSPSVNHMSPFICRQRCSAPQKLLSPRYVGRPATRAWDEEDDAGLPTREAPGRISLTASAKRSRGALHQAMPYRERRAPRGKRNLSPSHSSTPFMSPLPKPLADLATSVGTQLATWDGSSHLHDRLEQRLRLTRWMLGAGVSEANGELTEVTKQLEMLHVGSTQELMERWDELAPHLLPAPRSLLGARVSLTAWLRDAGVPEICVDESLGLLASAGLRNCTELRMNWYATRGHRESQHGWQSREELTELINAKLQLESMDKERVRRGEDHVFRQPDDCTAAAQKESLDLSPGDATSPSAPEGTDVKQVVQDVHEAQEDLEAHAADAVDKQTAADNAADNAAGNAADHAADHAADNAAGTVEEAGEEKEVRTRADELLRSRAQKMAAANVAARPHTSLKELSTTNEDLDLQPVGQTRAPFHPSPNHQSDTSLPQQSCRAEQQAEDIVHEPASPEVAELPEPVQQTPEIVAVLQALAKESIKEAEEAVAHARQAGVDPVVLSNLADEPLRWLHERGARRQKAASDLSEALMHKSLPGLALAFDAALSTGVAGPVVDEAAAALVILEAEANEREAAQTALHDAVLSDNLLALPECIERAIASGVDSSLVSAGHAALRKLEGAVADRKAADEALRIALAAHHAASSDEESAHAALAEALRQSHAAGLESSAVDEATNIVEAWSLRRAAQIEATDDLTRAMLSVDTDWISRSLANATGAGADAALLLEARLRLEGLRARYSAEDALLRALLSKSVQPLRAAIDAARAAGVAGPVVDEAAAALVILEAEANEREAAQTALHDAVLSDNLLALPECIERAIASGVDSSLVSAGHAALRKLEGAVADRKAADEALRIALAAHHAASSDEESAHAALAEALRQSHAAGLESSAVEEAAGIVQRVIQEREAQEAARRLQSAQQAEEEAATREAEEEARLAAMRARVAIAQRAAQLEEEAALERLEQHRLRRQARLDEERRARAEAEKREEREREELREAVRQEAVRGIGAAGQGSILQQIRQRHAAAAASRAKTLPSGQREPQIDSASAPAVLLALSSDIADPDALVAAAAEAAGIQRSPAQPSKAPGDAIVTQRL